MTQELTQSVLNTARNDKFIMVITKPLCMKDIIVPLQTLTDKDTANMDSFQFSIMNIPLPEFEINTENLHYAGGNLQISSHSRPPMADMNVSAIVNNKYTNWWFVYKWMNMIHDHYFGVPDKDSQYITDSNITFLPKDYIANITVYALDEYNKHVMRWDYINCFPCKIGEYRNAAEFAYNGSPSEIVCGMKFKYSTVKAQPIIDSDV
jgi:hypothetical protein